MRVLFLSGVYPYPDAPTHGTFCVNLLRAMTRMHDVRVVCPRSWSDRLRGGRSGGPRSAGSVDKSEPRAEYPTFFHPPWLLHNHHGWFMSMSARGAVRSVLSEFRPDCVLSYWVRPDGEWAVRVARSLRIPVGLIVGGSDVLIIPHRYPRRRRRFESVLRSVDAVFTVSEDLRSKVIELGVAPNRAHVAYQGVDSTVFFPGETRPARRELGIPEDVPVWLWVGRMVPVEALDVLVRACAQVRDEGRDFRLYLVGDGPLRRSLKSTVDSLGLEDCVLFAGPQPQAALPTWYRAADWFVLPSYSEGLPNVLREARSCGRPFVATRVGSVEEIADATSLLVEPGSPAALADALRLALAGPTPHVPPGGQMGWDESARGLADVLENTIRGRGRVAGAGRGEGDSWRGEVTLDVD